MTKRGKGWAICPSVLSCDHLPGNKNIWWKQGRCLCLYRSSSPIAEASHSQTLTVALPCAQLSANGLEMEWGRQTRVLLSWSSCAEHWLPRIGKHSRRERMKSFHVDTVNTLSFQALWRKQIVCLLLTRVSGKAHLSCWRGIHVF